MDDVTDTWLGRAIRGAAADAARRVPTEDEYADDRTERYVEAVVDNNESDDE